MLALKQERTTTRREDFLIDVSAGFRCESGDALPDSHLRVRVFGDLERPVVVVAGGISSGRCLDEWWSDQVGEGAAIDLTRYCAIGFDFSPTEDQRVRLSPLDQARLVAIAIDSLGVERLFAWVGASYGAMVGLAFAADAPTRLERLCAISTAHKPAALARGWRGVQRRVVEFALAQGVAEEGLSLARQLAMITYRSAEEFDERFPGGVGADGRSELDRYLVSRGDAYVSAMAPQRWLSLSESIDRLDVEPARVRADVTLAACPTDQIAPIESIQELSRRLPNLRALHELPSLYGHDAFLKEPAQVAAIIRSCLEGA
ncbi:MAG: alpha/beta fold hydrolase [Alphaproteobacteria bacterium]|nr:alpha/beta fold hydrolase [Alphaproteobacteria bacterium]